jgi:hypothetical protein
VQTDRLGKHAPRLRCRHEPAPVASYRYFSRVANCGFRKNHKSKNRTRLLLNLMASQLNPPP